GALELVDDDRTAILLAGRWLHVGEAHAVVAMGAGVHGALAGVRERNRRPLAGFQVDDQTVLVEPPVDEADHRPRHGIETELGTILIGRWETVLGKVCTIPEPAMVSATWDRTPYAMEARILQPLFWFGLLEHRSEKIPHNRFGEHHFYRKATLFNRMLTFDVVVDSMNSARH